MAFPEALSGRALVGWCRAILVLALVGAGAQTVRAAFWPFDDAEFAPLAKDRRVHYEPGAEAYARAVAALLPTAIAAVEAAHGRPFSGPIRVTVYATDEAYVRDNGTGDASARGVMHIGRILLSPRLWRDAERARGALPLILTHELSHLHFYAHAGAFAYIRMPGWFLEGMAVMVSGGGGAERLSPQVARAAIAAGRTIRITDATGLFGSGFDDPQPRMIADGDEQYYFHMYYRQAALFLEHLRATNPAGFAKLIRSLLDADNFTTAFQQSLGVTPTQAWRAFVAQVKAEAVRG